MTNLKLDTKWKQEYADEVTKMTGWELLNEVISCRETLSDGDALVINQNRASWQLGYVWPKLVDLLVGTYGWLPPPEGFM